ncbi:MAG TPA: hypothetical protein VNT79_08560, partial [Phycisphaerae bacterium]|nr:hypothetical protein [Phycisphaerae bacterium]
DHPRVTGDVSFLEGQELAQYGGCGYIYYAGEVGIDPGFNIIEDFFFGPDDIGRMMGIESCSNATPLAGAALLMAMFFSRNTLRRRFGRRR